MLTALAWLLVGLAMAGLLARARPSTPRLAAPAASSVVPPYVLVWSGTGAPPPLEPAPVHTVPDLGAARSLGVEQALVLDPGVTVVADLPARLAACGAFVSVFPMPTGRATAEECWVRDFAGPNRVRDATSPAGFADARCAWFPLADLDLPGEGVEPLLRAARARKAHGLPVELRDGRDESGRTCVAGVPTSPARWTSLLSDVLLDDPVLRAFLGLLPVMLAALALAAIAWHETRATGLLVLFLGVLARTWRAFDLGFGGAQALLGIATEPLLSIRIWRHRPTLPPAPFPTVQTGPAPRLTGPQTTLAGMDARLDASAVLHLARRVGGAAAVMEQIYGNRPSGQTPFGRVIDRWVHASAGARALRFRRLSVTGLLQALRPASVVSVPAGSARDVAPVDVARVVLVDPDPMARALAAGLCPRAEIVAGTVETTPPGPFEVAVYVGLAEYLDDADVVRHLVVLRARLEKGGALITSTTAPHPDQRFMAERLGWRTRSRRHEAYGALLDAAGYRVEQRLCDPLGIQWVFLARPIGQRGSGPNPSVPGASST
ncbi:class I SAM-dependent methyltransferase family protein [Myxococcota bacterium]|nr:class I SAM-dependent methyltransferase family protein [Myxococcota bacterium]